MKSIKRILVLFITLMFAVSIFAGCGQKAPESKPAETKPAETKANTSEQKPKEITLKMWGAVQENMGPLDLINSFMKANPGIKVEYVFYKNDDAGNTKINTALMSGEDIDVFINYGARRVVPRAEGNLLEDLSPYVEKDKLNMEESFGKGYLTMNNKIYGIPGNTLKTMVWLNKKALDEAGLPIPTDDWTWDDFKAYAIKLTKGEGANKRYGSVFLDPGYSFTMPARGLLGSDMFYKEDGTSNLDHPAFKKSLEFKLELENKLKVSENRIELLSAKINYYAEFFTGKAAMMVGSDAMLRHANNIKDYPRDWQIVFANLPKYDKDTKVNYNGRSFFDYISMGAKGKNKEAAWKLIKFMATEGSADMFKYGRASAWKKIDTKKVTEFIFDDNTKKLVDMDSFNRVFMDFKSPEYNDNKLKAYSQIDAIMTQEYEKAQTGSITVDQAIANMKKRSDEEIAKAK